LILKVFNDILPPPLVGLQSIIDDVNLVAVFQIVTDFLDMAHIAFTLGESIDIVGRPSIFKHGD